jgi:hypothetical protein
MFLAAYKRWAGWIKIVSATTEDFGLSLKLGAQETHRMKVTGHLPRSTHAPYDTEMMNTTVAFVQNVGIDVTYCSKPNGL